MRDFLFLRIILLRCFLDAQRQRHNEPASFADNAGNFYRSSDHIQQLFRDCQTESRTVNPAQRRILLTLKRFENTVHKFFTDADAVIFDNELICPVVLRRAVHFFLHNDQNDPAVRFHIFYRIVRKICKDLGKFSFIGIHAVMYQVGNVQRERNVLFRRSWQNAHLNLMRNLHQAAFIIFHACIAGLQSGNLQHVV